MLRLQAELSLRCESTTNSTCDGGAALFRGDFVDVANGFVHKDVIEVPLK